MNIHKSSSLFSLNVVGYVEFARFDFALLQTTSTSSTEKHKDTDDVTIVSDSSKHKSALYNDSGTSSTFVPRSVKTTSAASTASKPAISQPTTPGVNQGSTKAQSKTPTDKTDKIHITFPKPIEEDPDVLFVPTDVEKEYELEVDKETPRGKRKKKAASETKMTASSTYVGTSSSVKSTGTENVVNTTAAQNNTSPPTSKTPTPALTRVKTSVKQGMPESSETKVKVIAAKLASAGTPGTTASSALATPNTDTTLIASSAGLTSDSKSQAVTTTAGASKTEPTESLPAALPTPCTETDMKETPAASKAATPTTTTKSSTPFMSFINKRKIPSMGPTASKITKIVIHKTASSATQSTATTASSTVAPGVTSTSSSTVSNTSPATLTVTTMTGIPWLSKSATPVVADSSKSSSASPVPAPTVVVSSGQTPALSAGVQPYKSSKTTNEASLRNTKAPAEPVAQPTTKPQIQPVPSPVQPPSTVSVPDLVPWYATPPVQTSNTQVSSHISSTPDTTTTSTIGYPYNSQTGQWQGSGAWQTSAAKPQVTTTQSWSTNTASQYQYNSAVPYDNSTSSPQTAGSQAGIPGMEQYSEAGYEYDAHNNYAWYSGTGEQGETQSGWSQQTSSWTTSSVQTYNTSTPHMVPPPTIPPSGAPNPSLTPSSKLPDVPPPPIPKLATPPLPPFLMQQGSSTPNTGTNMKGQAEQGNWNNRGRNICPPNLTQNQEWKSQLDSGPMQHQPGNQGLRQPSLELSGFQQSPARLSSPQQPPPRMGNIRHPSLGMGNVRQPPPRIANVQEQPPRLNIAANRPRMPQSSDMRGPPPDTRMSQGGSMPTTFTSSLDSRAQNMPRLPQNQGPGGPLQQRLAHLAANNPLRPKIMRPLGPTGRNQNIPPNAHISQAGDNSPQSNQGQMTPYMSKTQSPRGPSAVPNLQLGPVPSAQKTSPDQISPKDPLTKGWKTRYGQEFRSKLMGTAASRDSNDGWESACWPTTTDHPPQAIKTNNNQAQNSQMNNDQSKKASKVKYVFGSTNNKVQNTNDGKKAGNKSMSRPGNQLQREMMDRQPPAPILTGNKFRGQAPAPVSVTSKAQGQHASSVISRVQGQHSSSVTTPNKAQGPAKATTTKTQTATPCKVPSDTTFSVGAFLSSLSADSAGMSR